MKEGDEFHPPLFLPEEKVNFFSGKKTQRERPSFLLIFAPSGQNTFRIPIENSEKSWYSYRMKKSMHIKRFCLVLILSLIMGCATGPKQDIAKVFYPPPPDLARLQFLASYTAEADIAKKKSAFESFVTGVGDSRRRLDKPYGVAIRDGKIYVCDLNQGVIVFDFEKKSFDGLQGARGTGKLMQPVNIRIDPEGVKYVSDPVRGQVVVFDKNDFFVAAFGMSDDWKPVDAVPFGDELYVADMKNFQVVVTNKKTGAVMRRFGQEGPAEERIGRPTNLAFDSEGHLFVSDAGRFQIVKFDRDGHYLGIIGEQGAESGRFARPRGIALDRENRIYAVDAAFDNVQVFNKDGNLLSFFAGPGTAPGNLSLAAQVAVDYDNLRYFQQFADPQFELEYLVIVTSQFGKSMVNIYGYGKERGKKYPVDAELLEKLKERLRKSEKEKSPEKKQESDITKP